MAGFLLLSLLSPMWSGGGRIFAPLITFSDVDFIRL